jgi:hypothetical protein
MSFLFGMHRSAVRYGICLFELIDSSYGTRTRTSSCDIAPERGAPRPVAAVNEPKQTYSIAHGRACRRARSREWGGEEPRVVV